MPSLVAALSEALALSGISIQTLGALGLAWARVMPAVALVPAFGLRALPAPARAVTALALAGCVFPAVAANRALAEVPYAEAAGGAWAVLAIVEVARGLPVAFSAAIPLWAATMAGGVADALRGSQEAPAVAAVEGRATPLGVVLSLLGSAIFLSTGGPARVARALALAPWGVAGHPSGLAGTAMAVSEDLVAGIALAVALGAPLLAAAVVVEIAGALIARAASPAQVHTLLAPIRAMGTLAVMAVVFERIAAALARAVHGPP
jgi:type III secretory pathway component EscT